MLPALLLSMLSPDVHAETLRHAIVVGANAGSGALGQLRYAEEDARRMASVLVELGGFRADQVTVLYGPDSSELDAALAEHAQIARATADDLFLFYYSGHADPQGLRLGDETYAYTALRRTVREIPSDVRIGVLDACRSGEITRVKGMELSAPFASEVVRGLDAEGEAWITATAPGEAAQESDTLRGSFFTHYLTSGLRGAADADDGLVSLGEAYAYAYDRTVARTATTTGGTQHPAYDFRLQGRGDLPLTDVRKASATLVLPEEMAGELTVLRSADEAPLIEVSKRAGTTVRIGVEPGRYTLRLRTADGLLEARAGLEEGSSLQVRGLQPVALASAARKGDDAELPAAEAPAAEAPAAEIPAAEAPADAGTDRMWGGLNRRVGGLVARLDQTYEQKIIPRLDSAAGALEPRGRRSEARGEESSPSILSVPSAQPCAASDLLCLEPGAVEATLPDGPVQLRWDGDALAAEGTLSGGKRTGRWVYWYPNGERQAEGTWWEGQPNGTWTWWSPDGQRLRRGTYEAGKRQGLWTEWSDTGTRKQQVAYDADIPNGRITTWYDSGKVQSQGRMALGKPQGSWTFWHETGKKAAKGDYVAGLKEGDWTTWHPNGTVESELRYRAGLAHGDAKTWWSNGKKASVGAWQDGKKQGLWKTWDEAGQLQSRGSYAQDVPVGRWRERVDGKMRRVRHDAPAGEAAG